MYWVGRASPSPTNNIFNTLYAYWSEEWLVSLLTAITFVVEAVTLCTITHRACDAMLLTRMQKEAVLAIIAELAATDVILVAAVWDLWGAVAGAENKTSLTFLALIFAILWDYLAIGDSSSSLLSIRFVDIIGTIWGRNIYIARLFRYHLLFLILVKSWLIWATRSIDLRPLLHFNKSLLLILACFRLPLFLTQAIFCISGLRHRHGNGRANHEHEHCETDDDEDVSSSGVARWLEGLGGY